MNELGLCRLPYVHVYTVRLLNYKTHVKFLHMPCTAEAPAVSLKPQATPVFPVITTIVICCLFCRFHFLEGTGTRTGWLPAYLGESDSANCASYTAEHKVQKFYFYVTLRLVRRKMIVQWWAVLTRNRRGSAVQWPTSYVRQYGLGRDALNLSTHTSMAQMGDTYRVTFLMGNGIYIYIYIYIYMHIIYIYIYTYTHTHSNIHTTQSKVP